MQQEDPHPLLREQQNGQPTATQDGRSHNTASGSRRTPTPPLFSSLEHYKQQLQSMYNTLHLRQ